MELETDEGLALIMDTYMWMKKKRQEGQVNEFEKAKADAEMNKGSKGGLGVNTFKAITGVQDQAFPGTIHVEGASVG